MQYMDNGSIKRKNNCEKIAGKNHLQPSDNANTLDHLIVIGDLDSLLIHCIKSVLFRSVLYQKLHCITTSWGGGGVGRLWPPNFWPTTLFSGFSHTTDRSVVNGFFMSVIYGNVR